MAGSLFFALSLAPPVMAQVVALGQSDNFESGRQGWSNGGLSAQPSVQAGGAAGPTDHYLQVTANGQAGEAGGKLTVFNRTQWKGDYNTAGITGIEMDLRAFSSSVGDLSIRIAFKEDISSGAGGYASSTAFGLPVDGQWHHATFQFSDLTIAEGAPPSLSTILANAPELRILHSAAPNELGGDVVTAQIGLDNITAVPEVNGAFICGLILVGYAGLRRASQSSKQRRSNIGTARDDRSTITAPTF